jgi:hypothetical protein
MQGGLVGVAVMVALLFLGGRLLTPSPSRWSAPLWNQVLHEPAVHFESQT